MKWHQACGECVMNHHCLMQDDDDVESCGGVGEYERAEDPEDDEEDIDGAD